MAERKKPPPPRSVGGPRKRRRDKDREKLEHYGVDLPEIPGLPVTIIPLHIFALKQTLASIESDFTEQVLSPSLDDDTFDENICKSDVASIARRAGSLDSAGDSLVARLVSRVEQAAATEEVDAGTKREVRQRHEQRQESIQTWLGSIYKEIRDCKKDSECMSKIPVAAMKHLWEMAVDHDRVCVRRAALFMSGNLLKKSSDVRRWLIDDTACLAEWVNVVVQQPQEGATRERTLLQHRLWQREGFLWMKVMHEETSFGGLYPRLCAAMQRIQQQCPWVVEDDVNSLSAHSQNLQAWRTWRDLALKHYEEEETRVRNILKRCSNCFDILAPGVVDAVAKDPSEGTQNGVDDFDEDEDKDVDWEDGWDGQDGDLPTQTESESHKEAVERTLAAMKATTRGLENGLLEIDMKPDALQDNNDPQAACSKATRTARKKLAKIITIFNQRHLPRLSQWIDGLTKSDSLVTNKDGALVQLNDELRQKRKRALETSIELKSMITSTMSSARRLEASEAFPSGSQPSDLLKTSGRAGISARDSSVRSTDLVKRCKGQSSRIRINYKTV